MSGQDAQFFFQRQEDQDQDGPLLNRNNGQQRLLPSNLFRSVLYEANKIYSLTPRVQADKSKVQGIQYSTQQQEPRIYIDENHLRQTTPLIFQKKKQDHEKVNIFTNKKSFNLLNISQQTPNSISIFDKIINSRPIVIPQYSEEDSQGSQPPIDLLTIPQTKQSTEKNSQYQYEEFMKILKTFKLIKFRAGTSPTKDTVQLSIVEKNEADKNVKILYLLIKTCVTHLLLYNCMILKNIKIQQFMCKGQNLKMTVAKIPKGGVQSQKKNQFEQIKIQFRNLDEATMFKQTIKQYFKDE